MIYKTEFNLKQITPMYHFKYGVMKNDTKKNTNTKEDKVNREKLGKDLIEINALSLRTNEGLRATELKPRFISHLIENSIINDDKDSKHLFQQSIKLIVTQESPNVSKLNFDKGMVNYANNYTPLNTNSTIEIKNNFIMFNKTVVTLKAQRKDSPEEYGLALDVIEQVNNEFIKFINTYCFGKRSGKGYGSFMVESNSRDYDNEQTVDFTGKEVTENLKGYNNFSSIENFASNIKKRSRIESNVNDNFYISKDSIDNISLIKNLMGSTKIADTNKYNKHLDYNHYMNRPVPEKFLAPYWFKPISNDKIRIYYNRPQLEKNIKIVMDNINPRYKGKSNIEDILDVMDEIFPKVIEDATFMKEAKQKNNVNRGRR